MPLARPRRPRAKRIVDGGSRNIERKPQVRMALSSTAASSKPRGRSSARDQGFSATVTIENAVRSPFRSARAGRTRHSRKATRALRVHHRLKGEFHPPVVSAATHHIGEPEIFAPPPLGP